MSSYAYDSARNCGLHEGVVVAELSQKIDNFTSRSARHGPWA